MHLDFEGLGEGLRVLCQQSEAPRDTATELRETAKQLRGDALQTQQDSRRTRLRSRRLLRVCRGVSG